MAIGRTGGDDVDAFAGAERPVVLLRQRDHRQPRRRRARLVAEFAAVEVLGEMPRDVAGEGAQVRAAEAREWFGRRRYVTGRTAAQAGAVPFAAIAGEQREAAGGVDQFDVQADLGDRLQHVVGTVPLPHVAVEHAVDAERARDLGDAAAIAGDGG